MKDLSSHNIQTITYRPSHRANGLVDKLRKLAEKDNRSLNSYIELVLLNHVNKPSNIKNTKSDQIRPNPTKNTPDIIDMVLQGYCDAYLEVNNEQYVITTKGKDRDAIGGIVKVFKDKYPTKDSEACKSELKKFFRDCLTIEDPWLRENMSPAIIKSQWNKIKKILKEGKSKNVKPHTYDEAIKIARDSGNNITDIFRSVPQPDKKPLWVLINESDSLKA